MTDPQPQQDWRPVPDPSALTDAAIVRATAQFRRELLQLQQLIEARLAAMDKATELLATTVGKVPSDTDKATDGLRLLISARLDGMDIAISLTSEGLTRVLTETERTAVSRQMIIETRLAAMDEATKLLATNVDKVPYAILQEAGNLKAFIMSRVDEVGHVTVEQFSAVNSQFASNDKALTAALAAQKEAAAEQNKANTTAIDRANQTTKETIAANAATTANSLTSISATIADLKDRLVRLESGGVATIAAHQEQREARSETRLNLGTVVSVALLMIAVLTFIILYVTKK